MIRKLIVTALVLLAPALSHGQAANYPNKPIRIIVPFTAGSGADSSSRAYGEILSKLFGQPVIVENRPGASGILAMQAVKNAPADGYTILTATNSPMTVNPVVMKNLPYDSLKDFRPVIGVSKGPVAFIVKADSPYKTMKDLIDAARKEGKGLAVGNYSAGYELIGAWLGNLTGLPIIPVTYKGGDPMMIDVIGGQLTTAATDFGGAAPRLRENRLRALAISADVRDPAFPDIPTMKESGFPEFESWVWTSFFVRADTPDDITQKLYEGFKRAMATPEGRAYQASLPSKLMDLGPADMRAFISAELERFRGIAKAAGIQPK